MIAYAVLVIGSLVVAFPLLLAFSYAFMTPSQIASYPPPVR